MLLFKSKAHQFWISIKVWFIASHFDWDAFEVELEENINFLDGLI
jgi:hypothetical protein